MNELSPIKKIPGIIQMAVYEDDPEIAFNEIKKLNDLSEMVEEAKGVFIHEMSKVWDQFSISKKESLQAQAYLYLNWHPHTVDRYITEAAYHNQLPESIQEKPLRERSPIAKAISQGWEPSDEQWDRLDKATNLAETHEVLRDVRKREPKKGSLQGNLHSDGSLVCWYNGVREDVGFLDIDNKSEAVQKLIRRIVKEAGIIRK